MQKGIKITLTRKEYRHVLQALRALKENLEYCIENGANENIGYLQEETAEVSSIIQKIENL